MLLTEKDHIVITNDKTRARLEDAVAHAKEEGGDLLSTMETSLEHLDRVGANMGRVRISSEDFNFFNLWFQRKNARGEWETCLSGALVGFGLKYEYGRIRVRDSGAQEWSIHS